MNDFALYLLLHVSLARAGGGDGGKGGTFRNNDI
jgi:hypothetical protein